MIQNFYIITESGGLLFHKDYEDRRVNPSLLSGFVSAISNFAETIGEGSIKSMIIANKKWFYIFRNDIIAIAIAETFDDEEIAHEFFLEPLTKSFFQKFRHEIPQFSGDNEKFKKFESMVDSQKNVYKIESARKTNLLTSSQSLTLAGAVEIFGVENIALVLRHAACHKLAIIGDEFIGKKFGALLQSLAPIHITSEINQYTDVYVATDYPLNPGFEISTFSLLNKGWTNQKFFKASYEKGLIKNILKKKTLGDMDLLLLFRSDFIALTEKITDYINTVWKFKDSPSLQKELKEIIKEKNQAEFLHDYIKKNVGLDVEQMLEDNKKEK